MIWTQTNAFTNIREEKKFIHVQYCAQKNIQDIVYILDIVYNWVQIRNCKTGSSIILRYFATWILIWHSVCKIIWVKRVMLLVCIGNWKGNVILMKFSSLAALEVVKMTTSGAASDENFIKMITFAFQYWCIIQYIPWFMHMVHSLLCFNMQYIHPCLTLTDNLWDNFHE